MRQPAIPKLSELSIAARAELLSHLDRHAGQTPSRFAEQSRAAGQRSGLATPGAQIWRP